MNQQRRWVRRRWSERRMPRAVQRRRTNNLIRWSADEMAVPEAVYNNYPGGQNNPIILD